MSKCIKCGNLFINNPPDGEMCHICRIADLEAKLAESEKAYTDLKELEQATKESLYASREYLDELKSEKWALERQLAEKEERIAELEDKDWYEGLIKQLEEANGRLIKQRDDAKLQLAEKEKEVEKLQHCNDRLAQGIYHSYGEHFILKVKQNKISFAVEQLDKVLSSIKATIELAENRHQMKDQVDIIIDNQIKELKEKNDD